MFQESVSLSMKVGRPPINDGVDAGSKGEGGNQHLIIRANAAQLQGQMQSGRSGAERQRVRRAHNLGKFLLKGVNVGAKRGDPVGGKGFGNIFLLAAGHVGGREVDAGHGDYELYEL
jgi:hypothetical protein